MLAAPEQIVSVTHLAQQEAETPLWRQARRYPRNDGSLLSVVAAAARSGRDDGRRRAATGCASPQRLGIPTLDLPFAQSLADVGESIRAAGGRARAARGGRGAAAADDGADAQPPAARASTRSGSAAAGAPSPAERARGAMDGAGGPRPAPDAGRPRARSRRCWSRPPAILLRSDYRAGPIFERPALARPSGGAARARARARSPTDGRRWTCMGPLLIDEIDRLRRAVGAMSGARSALLLLLRWPRPSPPSVLLPFAPLRALFEQDRRAGRGGAGRAAPAPRAARARLWRDARRVGRGDPGAVRQPARLARPHRHDQRRGAGRGGHRLSVRLRRAGRACRSARWPARSARSACCSRWPGRRRRRRPCCSPASRSARWPGR